MADGAEEFTRPPYTRAKNTFSLPFERPTPPLIVEFVARYHYAQAKFIAEGAEKLINKKLAPKGEGMAAGGVQGFVKSRAKTKESLEKKLKMKNERRKKPYETREELMEDAGDVAGVRVVLYTPSESQYEKVDQIIKELFGANVEMNRPQKRTQDPDQPVLYEPIHLGYQGRHYWVTLEKSHRIYKNGTHEEGDRIEIQVTSALGHAWAEAGHDVLYKSYAFGQASVQEQRIFDALNGLVLSGDLLLQQVHELLMQRTYEKIEYVPDFEICLRNLDVLQGHDLEELMLRDCTDLVLKVFRKVGKNHTIAIRKTIRDLGYPDEPRTDSIIASFEPTFKPASGLAFVISLMHELMPLDFKELQAMGLVKNVETLGSLAASDKCCLMINALALLQDVFGNERDRLRDFLVEEVNLPVEVKKSLDWVLEDPSRHPLLQHQADDEEQANDEEQALIGTKISTGWAWFEQEAHNSKSVCGLAFRLAAVEATKPFSLSFLAKVKNIGTLSRSSTGNSAGDWP